MIKGMTGFGCADVTSGKLKGTIEIKSLNHRYLDIGYYLPSGFASIENKIRDLVSQRMERGRVTISIRITSKPDQVVSVNKNLIRAYLHQGKILTKEFGLNGQLTLSELIHLPGVLDVRETTLTPEVVWPILEEGFKKALSGLLTMREREGKSLAKDMNKFLLRMLLQLKKINSRVKIILKDKKKELTDEEFSSFQKSSDVNEENARLTHHIEEFKILLKSNAAMGKKLDFIAQEMQRETNTIGSKLQDKIISDAVIALKSKIEKIREQSQNIE